MDYNRIIKEAKEMGISDIEINMQSYNGIDFSLFKGELEKNQQKKISNMTLRGIYNNKLAIVKLENLEENHIIEGLRELKELAKTITNTETVKLFSGSKEYPTIPPHIENIMDIDMEEKLELVKKLELSITQYDNRIAKEVQCGYEELSSITTIVNSKGLNVSNQESIAYLYASALAKDGEDLESSFEVQAEIDFAKFNPNELGKKIAFNAISMLGAKPVPSKQYDIVFKPETFAKLLNAFSPIFNGEMAMKKLSPLRDMIDKKIMGDNITIVDEGINLNAHNFQTFDSEGVATKTKEIVKNGLFKSFLHNLQTAEYFKTEPTGNGTKNGVTALTMYLKPGKEDFNDIIKDIKDGLYITNMQGLHAGLNVQSGDFNLQSSGFRIKEGKISEPFNLVIVSDNFLDMMKEVTNLGNDLTFHFNSGSPTVRVKPLYVSGI